MKRPRKLSTDRARRFCQALESDAAGRMQWWSSIAKIGSRLGLEPNDAILLADDCAAAGYVAHDQSQHIKEGRRAEELPHSVTLREAGRQLARGS